MESISQMMESAMKARSHFIDGDYSSTVDDLRNVSNMMGNKFDARLSVNMIITDYLAAGSRPWEDLFVSLLNVLSLTLKDLDDNLTKLSKVLSTCTPEKYVLLFNIASLCCMCEKLDAALAIVDFLYSNITIMEEEGLQLRVILLNVSITLKQLQLESVCCHRETSTRHIARFDELMSHLQKKYATHDNPVVQHYAQFLMHLYNACYAVLSLNFKTAKKEIKSSSGALHKLKSSPENLFTSHPTSDAVQFNAPSCDMPPSEYHQLVSSYVKGFAEYANRNYAKCFKLLTSHKYKDMPYFNNLGVLCLQMEYSASAVQFFQHALAATHSPACVLPSTPMLHVIYNYGLALLHQKDPASALQCFLRVSSYFGSKALVWIRMAECCIMFSHTQSQRQSFTVTSQAHEKRVRSFFLELVSPASAEKMEIDADELSYKQALLYLQKAHGLLYSSCEWILSKSDDDSADDDNRISLTHCREELLLAVNLKLAFVHLQLQDWVRAQNVTYQLLDTRLDQIQRFQVECYAVEALCNLGRFDEALRLLDLQLLVKDDADSNSGATMPYPVMSDLNRAIVCCYQNKYSDAYVNLVRLREKYPYLTAINRSFLFVLLRLGLHKDALLLVRSCHSV